jgi:hypothetical protein
MRSTRFRAAAALAGAAVAIGTAVVAIAGPAAAATPRVTVTNEFGSAKADLTYSTTIHVEGSGFQSVQGGFGGIYVLFGWVSDPTGSAWKPSKGGATGETYRYVPDSEDKENQGFQRFVSFPGSETQYAANGGLLDASGHWSLDMIVPGPTFTAYDRSNDPVQVDCRVSTCGVITVGAHGVVNANNETFTPVSFAQVYGPGAAAPATGAAGTTQATATAAAPATTTTTTTTATTPATTTTAPATSGAQAVASTPRSSSSAVAPAAATTSASRPGTLSVDKETAVVGRVLAFTARGFDPGEQVVVVLDDGLAAVGPIAVAPDGSFAAILALPAAIGVGTHVLRATGSGSNTVVRAAFPVRADEDAAAPVAVAAAPPSGPSAGAWIFLAVSGVVLLAALALLVRRFLRRHRITDDLTLDGVPA